MKNRNIFFILTILLLLVGNALFNYKMDVYDVFNLNKNLYLNKYPEDLVSVVLKRHADKKYDYVLSGASPAAGMYGFPNKYKNIANLSYTKLNAGDATKLLDAFLSLHPEVKTVFFSIDYVTYLTNFEFELNVDVSKYDFKDINKLFLSFDTTKKGLKMFIDKHFPKSIEQNQEDNTFKIYPKRCLTHMFTYLDIKDVEKKVQKEQNDLKAIADKYNVDIVLFIPPFHSLFLGLIYESPFYEITNRIKRMYVDEYNQIIDMAFVNKHTSVSLWDYTFLYQDIVHPSFLQGVCLHDILFNRDDADKDIYMLITKENVEEVIKQQENLIKNYLKQNPDELPKVWSYNADPAFEDFHYTIVRDFSKLENENEKELHQKVGQIH